MVNLLRVSIFVMETEDNLFVNEVPDVLVGDEITEFLARVAPLIEEEAARSIDDRTRHTVLPSQFFSLHPHPHPHPPSICCCCCCCSC